ncbi:hypothetical protein PAB17_003480 [Salmonella enterica]|nr:hypothetical protein [Salmonella enterica]
MSSDQNGSKRHIEVQASEKHSKTHSEDISAKSQKQRLDAFKSVGMDLKKAFLGQDVLEKLAFIYEVQYGKALDTTELGYDVLGDLLSFCINKCYNSKEMALGRKRPVPIVKAAMTPAGQRLYRYYQMAMPVDGEGKDAMEIAERFNVENKRGQQYFQHISQVEGGFELVERSEDDEDSYTSNQGNREWLPREIQALWNRKRISKQIEIWNEQACSKHNRLKQK